MKKINIFSLGMIYAGCFLGAGFVSGQEIWQFFGAFGASGVWGIVLTFLLHFLFGAILIRLIHNTEITEMDKIVVWKNIPHLRVAVGAVTTFFMYSILIIMSAGAGALLNRMFALPQFIGCGLFCALIAYFSLRGVDGMIEALSKLVPPMVAGAVLIGFISVVKGGFNFNIQADESQNVLLNNWFLSAVTYASHNLFCSIGIIAPMAMRIDKKSVIPGIGAGSVIMLLIAACVLFGIFANYNVSDTELPMLELAYNISSVFGIIYAILMLFGMFGTSLSSMVGVIEYGSCKFTWLAEHKKTVVITLCTVGWLFSLAGFGDLIGIVYPVSGYFGFAVIISVIVHYVLDIKNKKCK